MGEFQGQYVNDVKLALKASALSGVHCVLLGAPGRGKTTITLKAVEEMFSGKSVFLRFDATTPPEKIQGYPDIAKLLSSTPVYELVRDGSIYDPNARCIVLDELFRAMDTSFDIVLDALDRQDVNKNDAPVAIATSNFSATSERTEALRDRFGLWVWLPSEPLDVKAIVANQLDSLGVGLDISDHLPDFNEIMSARLARPGKNAIKAVAEVCEQLANEAQKGLTDDNGNVVASFEVNPRRLDQWGRILFRMTYYLTGDADFTSVSEEAKRCLKWAFPLTDETQANQWAAICTSIADPVEGAVQSLLQASYSKFKDVNDRGLSKQAASLELGKVLSDGMNNLTSLGVDDPRIDKAISDLTDVYSKFVRGENPFE